MTVWLIGGTTESKEVAKAIAIAPVITVTTPEAKSLYTDDSLIIVGKMNRQAMKQFVRKYQVSAIVDASHPFAVEVSQNAIVTAKELQLPYLRYERSTVSTHSDRFIQLSSFEELLQGDYLLSKRVLLTIGCKALSLFESWHDRAVLYARVLPKLESLQIALDSGFSSDRIIALRPPVSYQLERALLKQWQISTIVTKASGKSGGEDIKQQLAQELDIDLITIARPQVKYPQQTSSLKKVLKFCLRNIGSQSAPT